MACLEGDGTAFLYKNNELSQLQQHDQGFQGSCYFLGLLSGVLHGVIEGCDAVAMGICCRQMYRRITILTN